jgi:hypothetical protein
MIERFLRTLEEECIWHRNFKSLEEANDVITEWIGFWHKTETLGTAVQSARGESDSIGGVSVQIWWGHYSLVKAKWRKYRHLPVSRVQILMQYGKAGVAVNQMRILCASSNIQMMWIVILENFLASLYLFAVEIYLQ